MWYELFIFALMTFICLYNGNTLLYVLYGVYLVVTVVKWITSPRR